MRIILNNAGPAPGRPRGRSSRARSRPRPRRRVLASTAAPTGRAASAWSRRRTSGAASPRSSAATDADVTSIITNPDADPHDYEPTPRDARAIASAAARDRERHRLRPVGAASCSTPTAASDRTRARRRRRSSASTDGGNPHQWYSPPTVAKVIDRVTADLARIDPSTRPTSSATRASSSRQGLARVQRADRRDQAAVRRHADRRVGEHRRAARRDARPEAGHARRRSSTRSRRATSRPRPTRRPSTRRSATSEIKVFVYNSQNATPDVQRLVDAARARAHPGRDRHRDAHARARDLPGSGRSASCARCSPRSSEATAR